MNLFTSMYQNKFVKLAVKTAGRSFSLIEARAKKVRADIEIFESNIPNDKKSDYGRIQAEVSYTLINIQKQSIKNNKKISIPSLSTLSLATGGSVRQITRIIKKLIKSKTIHLQNYFIFDDKTGEVLISPKNKLHRLTNGRLRFIVNPLKKVKEYIQNKKMNTVHQYNKTIDLIFQKLIRKYYERQVRSSLKTTDKGPNRPSDSDDEWAMNW